MVAVAERKHIERDSLLKSQGGDDTVLFLESLSSNEVKVLDMYLNRVNLKNTSLHKATISIDDGVISIEDNTDGFAMQIDVNAEEVVQVYAPEHLTYHPMLIGQFLMRVSETLTAVFVMAGKL